MTKSKFTAPAAAPVTAKRVRKAPEPKPTVTATPVTETESSSETLFERMRAAADDYWQSIHTPTWTRRVASVALGLITYGTVFYGCMQLVDTLCFAVIAYSGVGFLSFMCAFIGILLALIVATTAGTKVYEFAMNFEYGRVRDRVKNFFRISPRAEVRHA